MAKYGDKEPVYDEKIAPLMTQILAICNGNKINMIASFQLRSEQEDEDGHFLCTSALSESVEHFPDSFRRFHKDIVSKKPTMIAMTITKREG